MVSPTWEDEDLEWKNNLMKKVDALTDMVGTLMGGKFETPKEGKPKPKRRKRKEEAELASDLSPGAFINNLKGTLLQDPIQRDVDTVDGPLTVTNAILNTKYGDIRVALWREVGEGMMDHVAGDEVSVTNVVIKEPYRDMMQVSNTRNTVVR